MRRLILLRPEPGLSASARRAEAIGLAVVRHPLFEVEPLPAELPDGPFDALVLTSANAVRYAGPLLRAVKNLPTYTVGTATAAAATNAALRVVAVGTGGVEGLQLPPGRLLHLCGESHKSLPGDVVAVPVYRTLPIGDPLPPLDGAVIAVHSPEAGSRLDALAGLDRSTAAIAAISPVAADACGQGWASVESASAPDDQSLLALAAALCQSGAP